MSQPCLPATRLSAVWWVRLVVVPNLGAGTKAAFDLFLFASQRPTSWLMLLVRISRLSEIFSVAFPYTIENAKYELPPIPLKLSLLSWLLWWPVMQNIFGEVISISCGHHFNTQPKWEHWMHQTQQRHDDGFPLGRCSDGCCDDPGCVLCSS